MVRVLLIHAGLIPHYRIPIYGRLSDDLRQHGFDLTVASDGIAPECPFTVEFPCRLTRLSVSNLVQLVRKENIKVIIDYMELRHHYLFPTYLVVKGLLNRRMIYWGQGRDLLDPASRIKNLAYWLELAWSDAIVLYAEHLKRYVPRRFQHKIFVANNTLDITYRGLLAGRTKENVLAKYGITTPRNIICVGRIQKRKRIDHLVKAHALMKRTDIGLILAGPDPEGILNDVEGDTIFKIGPLYGDEKYDLLSSADVYCLPGAVGLGIVDAFHCGLPFVTEEGDESAEIMYLKDGVNGFVVPRGDLLMMSEKLMLLLEDSDLRSRFSSAARDEIRTNGNMDLFCSGFRKALAFAVGGLGHPRKRPEEGNAG